MPTQKHHPQAKLHAPLSALGKNVAVDLVLQSAVRSEFSGTPDAAAAEAQRDEQLPCNTSCYLLSLWPRYEAVNARKELRVRDHIVDRHELCASQEQTPRVRIVA
jgi:hypothetical protein